MVNRPVLESLFTVVLVALPMVPLASKMVVDRNLRTSNTLYVATDAT